MGKLLRNNLGNFLVIFIISVFVFAGLIYYFTNLTKGADSIKQIQILPTTYSGSWANSEAALTQDLEPEAGFEEFNANNSAYPIPIAEEEKIETLPEEEVSSPAEPAESPEEIISESENLEEAATSSEEPIIEEPTSPSEEIIIPPIEEEPISSSEDLLMHWFGIKKLFASISEEQAPPVDEQASEEILVSESTEALVSEGEPIYVELVPIEELATESEDISNEPIEEIATESAEPEERVIDFAPGFIESVMEFSDFGIPPSFADPPAGEAGATESKGEKEIKNIQLRLSLAYEAGGPQDSLVIEYAYSSSSWDYLAELYLSDSNSNATNGGYFLYALPIFSAQGGPASGGEKWQDLENLKIRFKYRGFLPASPSGGPDPMAPLSEINKPKGSVYLDALWLDVDYEGEKEKEKPEEIKEVEEKNFELDLISGKKDFKLDEKPELEFKYQRKLKKNLLEQATDGIVDIFRDEYKNIKIKVRVFGPDDEEIDYDAPDGFTPKLEYQKEGKFKVDLPKPKYNYSFFQPGRYKLVFEINDGDRIVTEAKYFFWGVLAINTNKSIYLANEQAYLQMAALEDDGNTICDANLQLEIKEPKGGLFGGSETTILSTQDNTIQYSGKCGNNNVTDVPDYFAYYQIPDKTGIYEMKLTNLDIPGHEITDYFEVKKEVPFDVERIGPTRIYPVADYEMKIKIKANTDFKGEIVETVPFTFAVTGDDISKQESNINNYTKTLTWENIELKAGDTYEIKYTFDAPNISPYLFLLGPLELAFSDERIAFKEARNWQIAADVDTEIFITDNDAPSGNCGSGCWTVPTLWNNASNSIEVIGGGGGGGDGSSGTGPGGAGGGAYARGVNLFLDLDSGATVSFGIGASGSGGVSTGQNGGNGGDTVFFTASISTVTLANCETVGSGSSSAYPACVGAAGGKGSLGAANTAGGVGGLASSSVGNTARQVGGDGGTGCIAGAGGGGGAGGPGGDGIGNDGAKGVGDANPGLGGGGGAGGGGSPGSVGLADGSPVAACTTTATPTTSVGGVGGANFRGTGGGAGGDITGGAGSAGGGGGGGDDGGTSGGTGGSGGAGNDFDSTHGSGGGGGGGGDGAAGGTGGNYGGGGGGGEACTVAGCRGAGGVIYIAYRPASRTITGNCKKQDQLTNCATCTGCIKVAIEGTINTGTAANIDASGNFTYTFGTDPVLDDVITIFKDNQVNASESVAVTKYDGSGMITGVQLYQQHLVIGSDDNKTVSNSDLGLYDVSNDEDVFHDAAEASLDVCGDGGDRCDDLELYIKSGSTYQPDSGGSSSVKTHDIEIDGTFDMTGTGNYASVSGGWDNDKTFTPGTSTIFFTASASAEVVSQSTDGTYAFNNVQFGDSATTGYTGSWTLNGNVTVFNVDGNLTVDGGTLNNSSANKNITLAGNLSLSSTGDYLTGSGGTFTFDGTTTPVTWTDSRTTKANMGQVSINGTTKTVTLGSSVKVEQLTIAASQILDLGSSGYTLTISGDGQTTNRPLQKSGTLDCGSNSYVEYIASQSTDIEDTDYFNLTLASASTNFYITGSAATIITSGSFNIKAGTFNGGDDTVILSKTGTGAFSVSGTFYVDTSTFNYVGDDATTVASGGYYNLQIGNATTQTAARTYTLDGNTTVANVLTLGPPSGSNTQILDASSYNITLIGNTPTPFLINSMGGFEYSTSTVSYENIGNVNVTATDYYGLGVGQMGGTGRTYTATGNIEVHNALHLNSTTATFNTFALGSNDFTVGSASIDDSGDFFGASSAYVKLTQSTPGTTVFRSKSGTHELGNAGGGSGGAEMQFYNLTLGVDSDNNSYTFKVGDEICVSGSFNLTSGGDGVHALNFTNFASLYPLFVWGDFTVGANASISAWNGTINLNGTTSTTFTDSSTNGFEPYNLTINKTDADDDNDNFTLASNLIIRGTTTITDGELTQGTASVSAEGSGGVSIGANGEWSNLSTGDLVLGGNFVNAGSVSFSANDKECGAGNTDDIAIFSTKAASQRTWSTSGGGTFNVMYNLHVEDQGGSITCTSCTDVTGNAWTFADCAAANSAPTIDAVYLGTSLRGGDSITLVEGTDIEIVASVQVTDTDTCLDISGVKAYVHRSNVDWVHEIGGNGTTCSFDYNDCYTPIFDSGVLNCVQQSCVVNIAVYDCGASISAEGGDGMWYHADPTDSTSSNSSDWWELVVIASDSVMNDVYATNSTETIDVNLLAALALSNASDSIAYGAINPGSETAAVLERGVRNTGNRGLDIMIGATSALENTTLGEDIATEQQQYFPSTFTVGNGTSLSGTAVEVNVDLSKPASHSAGLESDDQIFWGIAVPYATNPGLYSGQTTYTAVSD